MQIGSVDASGSAERILNQQGAALPIPREEEGGKSFGQFLTEALSGVNALQQNAGGMVKQFATGAPLDVHQVMIALEQASSAMALTIQVRNKLVEGYQEIMRTQV
jgi:flagellar hook-basal body complex protein FliE